MHLIVGYGKMGHEILAATLRSKRHLQEPWWVRWSLTLFAMAVMTVLIVIPVICVFVNAFADGPQTYWDRIINDQETLDSIRVTLTVAPIAVLMNIVFGISAAWLIARFKFPGRSWLIALIDLPFAVSPVVVGLMLILLFGRRGFLGPWLIEHDLKIVFAIPGMILATAFVTLPFVVRELIPVMEALGSDEEVAAVSLGANAWQLFWRVTLPNIKWGLLYGIILCNARAMGEYGAVYVVSGRIPNETDTMPIRIEKLFQNYDMPGAFAVASILTLLALVTLGVKVILERRARREMELAKQMRETGTPV